jgi:hypothetical protein
MLTIPEKAIANWQESAQVAGCLLLRRRSLKKGRSMTTRSRRETVHFTHSFHIRGVDRLLPPGGYEVITDEELIEGLSFPSFRRVATMILVPGAPPRQSSIEMISSDAQRIDASALHE